MQVFAYERSRSGDRLLVDQPINQQDSHVL